jgi:hypothetical protein
MGTQFPGDGRWTYLPFFRHVPGWEALRTPGRLIIWVTLGLCVLAAGALGRLRKELRLPWSELRSPRAVMIAGAGVLLSLIPAGVVVVEGAGSTNHWPVATSPVRLSELPGPVLLLPSDEVGDYHMMLWSTEGWPVLITRSRAVGTVWATAADRPVDGLGIRRTDLGNAVVFDLRPQTS